MRKLLILTAIFISTNIILANSVDEAYLALQENDRIKARELLELALSNPETRIEASLLLILLNTVEIKDENLAITKSIYNELPSPSSYLFPLWFDDAVTGGYMKKDTHRIELLEKMLIDDRLNGSVKAGIRYIIGMHYLFSNSMNEAFKIWKEVGSINNWQFVGPFNNTSGSGFNKEYGPLKHPEPGYEFLSNTNSIIKWFTPKHAQDQPWISTIYHVQAQEAVVFAQTFLYSKADREVIFALGGAGTLKLWINDKKHFEEQVEQRTEIDVYKFKAKLKKGYNRVLMQIGYSNNFSYPNFILRVVDENGNPDNDFSSIASFQSYKVDNSLENSKPVPHFAEEFFKLKIKEDTANILNYILLSKVYYRSSLFNKAIEILESGKKRNPSNILVEYELLQNYIQLGNRTELVKQLEHIRKIDPSSIFLSLYDYSTHLSEEDYDRAEKKLAIIKEYFGENNTNYLFNQLKLDIAKKDYQTMLVTINKLYNFFPDNPIAVEYKFSLLKNVDNTPVVALNLLKSYLATNYNQTLVELLLKEFKNQGQTNELEIFLIQLNRSFPESLEFAQKLQTFYYLNKNYVEALKWNTYSLDNAPYYAATWIDRAYIDEAIGKIDEAIKDLSNAIYFDPNLFDPREKLRELQGKKPIISLLRNTKVNEILDTESKKELRKDINYEYIFHKNTEVLFKEGSSISHYSYGVRLYNQSGIDEWKELELSVDYNRQKLIFEQAKVIKSDGKRIAAERNENHIVFPSLEAGDIILVEYRYENHVWGKLSREFWNKFALSSYVPVNNAELVIYAPKELDIQIVNENFKIEPSKENIDEFVCYKWHFEKNPAIEYESYMPSIINSGITVNLSTVKSWATISNWYKDLVLSNTVDDYIVEKTYNEIFKNFKSNLAKDKALAIYNYILDNIKYSYISFRQGNYVPQKPMITISTKLGDCKDLSLLYHALAKKAGLKTNLVLVNTRNTAEKLILPAIDFNHCIIKIDIDGKSIFQELTDSYLPFGAMSVNLLNSQALIIPNSEKENAGMNLINIPENGLNVNTRKRVTDIVIKNDKLLINTIQTLTGDMASGVRNSYIGKSETETKEMIRDFFDNFFEKDLKIMDYNFNTLEARNEPLIFHSHLEVENEVKSIGGLKMLKLPFFDEVVSLNNLPEKERKFPILYWMYENNTFYENQITVVLPENSTIVEKPADFKISDKFIDYQLTITSIDNKTIKVTRTVKIKETNLEAEYYPVMRDIIKKILKAEDIFVVYR